MSEAIYWGPCMREIMQDQEFMSKFPQGINASEMYEELEARGSNVAISATVLDVANYMSEIFGRPR
jgi:hypothetical protein